MTKYRIDSNEFGSVVWMLKSSVHTDWILLTEFWGELHRVEAENYVAYMEREDERDNA